MFDIGFSELMVIGLVALVVLGPERLPKVARTVGHLLGRVQRYVNDVKSDISREMQLDELRKLQSQVQDQARAMENSFRQGVGEVQSGINQAAADLEHSMAGSLPVAEVSAVEQTPAESAPAEEAAPVRRRSFVARGGQPVEDKGAA